MEPVDFKNEVWEIIREIMNQMENLFRPCYELYGLTVGQTRILFLLNSQKRTSITALSRLLSVTPGNLSVTCKRLESRGYLIRQRDKEDERVVWVSLSDIGRETVVQLRDKLDSRCSLILGEIPSKDLDTMIEGLRLLSDILKQADGSFSH